MSSEHTFVFNFVASLAIAIPHLSVLAVGLIVTLQYVKRHRQPLL